MVIPVFNEACNLKPLFDRLTATLDAFGKPFEILLTDDGSTDGSREILIGFYHARPDNVRVIVLRRNSGQHQAIMAAFERARGDVIVTLDADLQNPPEEIPKLLELSARGHDVVGGYRVNRQDSAWRTAPSRIINHLRAVATGIEMRDHGCMLRAYRKEIVQQIVTSREAAIYIPALAQHFAANPAEIEVGHAARAHGVSKYNLYKLIRLNFDLITGFTLVPLQLFTMFGMVIAATALLLVIYLALRRLIIGPEVAGVFTLFAILYFLVGILITGLGILGEYIGRIYQEVRRRPAYQVQSVYERTDQR